MNGNSQTGLPVVTQLAFNLSDQGSRLKAGAAPQLYAERNLRDATDPLEGIGKVWRVGIAASQETYLTDQITFPTEGERRLL